MEDFIYILIGVAWIAYSVYNQGQKQKRKQQVKPDLNSGKNISEVEKNVGSFFEKKLDLDSLFNLEEKMDKYVNNPFSEINMAEERDGYLDSPHSNIDIIEEKDESAFFNAETEGVSVFNEKYEIDKPEEDEKTNSLLQDILSDAGGFDARKAIIFSAILDPPYINN